jgi:two-component system OmpR family response regulator
VDDKREIRELVLRALERRNYRVTALPDAASARKILRQAEIDLVVLDIMLPGEDGLSLCRSIAETKGPPVILVTALGEESDRIAGLETGADDYLCKPFSVAELTARVRAVLRRSNSLPPKRREDTETGTLVFGRWSLDTNRRELMDEDHVVVALSTTEYGLLLAFLAHPGRTLTRDQLLDLTKGRFSKAYDRSIDNQVSRLRQKLEKDPKKPDLIQTVWGGGYRLAVGVHRNEPKGCRG